VQHRFSAGRCRGDPAGGGHGEIYNASVTSERRKGGHLLTALALLERDGDDLLALLDRDARLP
jgi:hypothetical protein